MPYLKQAARLLVVDDDAPLRRSIPRLLADPARHFDEAASLSEAIASGPYFKVMIVNILPPQLMQPFVDAAFKKRCALMRACSYDAVARWLSSCTPRCTLAFFV